MLLAGIATHGICEGLVKLCFRDHTVALSEHILSELREHYVGTFKATGEQASLVIETLRKQSELVIPAIVPAEVLRDADDLPVLGTALAASADFLITGDRELQDLAAYQKTQIVSPRVFYDSLRTTN